MTLALLIGTELEAMAEKAPDHTFEIGKTDFLLDGKPLVIRCGEIHFARVPREYWQDRLRRCRAMGLNAVCAYLFWNYHEWEEGKFDWEGQADAAEFCRLAQAEGLWVILRPGPYACAEWEMGGLPWWLLRNDGIRLRANDPAFMKASRDWLTEVGRTLAPLQVTHGGPILMVQVENEYGSYGSDAVYMKGLQQATRDAGFDVPLFQCNPRGALEAVKLEGLFSVVNFGSDPEGSFRALRKVQPEGPLMCGEFYPGWFDTWGYPHHGGNTAHYLADLESMLKSRASFSIYMAHGGTSFGMWSGSDQPFKPDTSSYDYDAPIGEAGWIGEKFQKTRDVISRYLEPGETLPDPPANLPTMEVPSFELTESAAVWDNLPAPVADTQPRTMEAYGQGRGCILYRTTLPAGPAATLSVKEVHDFASVFVDGKRVAWMDRRARTSCRAALPAREQPATLDILVEAMGRVNFGGGIADRKGLHGPVTVTGPDGMVPTGGWQVYNLDPTDAMLSRLQWKKRPATGPAFWHGTFQTARTDDTFLDLTSWGKGVAWVNGHCLGRFWNIGPTQSMYVPGPWLKAGTNDVVVLDLLGPEKPVLAGLAKPILNRLRHDLDMLKTSRAGRGKLLLTGVTPVCEGQFSNADEVQTVRFDHAVDARQLCLEMLDSQNGSSAAAIAELDLIDEAGNPLSHALWSIAYVDSEEIAQEDGSAQNAINGQTSDFWHSAWSEVQAPFPHRLILDLGATTRVAGLRYTPRAGAKGSGHLKDYRIYAGEKLVQPE